MNNISIVIPTYNRVAYLKGCIESCLNQTINCEIIVCDHGSTDGTKELASEYKERITYIRREKDFGVHFCWLDGIINAKGTFVHINYDDDWIEPTFIESCMKLFTPEVGFVFSNARVFWQNTNSYAQNLFDDFGKTNIYPIHKMVKFNLKGLISPACTIIRKSDIIDSLFIGKVPFSRSEYKGVGPDLLFTLMLSNKYKLFGFVSEPLSVFRAHEGSITTDASSSNSKAKLISLAYDQARVYYILTRIIRRMKVDLFIFKYLQYKKQTKKFLRQSFLKLKKHNKK
jgi:glycosyltransferase involved in cell wall biosynthesis